MTLMEVMLVMAIIAMVTAAASLSGIKVFGDSKEKSALMDARTIRAAVKTWRMTEDFSACPTIDQLVTDGVLDKDGHRSDPWGTAFKIACVSEDVTIRSAGPDREFETKDDLKVPKE